MGEFDSRDSVTTDPEGAPGEGVAGTTVEVEWAQGAARRDRVNRSARVA